MIDTVMVGQLGEVSIAAVGLANQYFFILMLMFFGINSGAGIFIAQYWGNWDISNIARAMGLSIIVGTLAAVVFTIPGVLFPKSIMRIFTSDVSVIEEGSKFLYIISFRYIITAISFSYATALRCTGNVKLPVTASAIALVTNTILNFVLITGKFGFPALGVSGSLV
jgi:Na+-driven multidrug efflux pump